MSIIISLLTLIPSFFVLLLAPSFHSLRSPSAKFIFIGLPVYVPLLVIVMMLLLMTLKKAPPKVYENFPMHLGFLTIALLIACCVSAYAAISL